ncbi:MAG: hypothetical protein RLZZ175_2531 [Bacteroidota bacterium]|jgi:hypothetical protein
MKALSIYYSASKYKVLLQANVYQTFESLVDIFKHFPNVHIQFDKNSFLNAFKEIEFKEEFTADNTNYVLHLDKLGIKNEQNQLITPPIFDQIIYYPNEQLYLIQEGDYCFVINSDLKTTYAPTLEVILHLEGENVELR